jgi:NodT family efflux transporter outer membrane factor (OMF) lipoprotein
VASVTVAGCTVGPDFEQPKPWWQPASWFQGRPGAANVARGTQPSIPVPDAIDPQWWKVFGDPELTNLEQRVAAANFDVRVATVRLAESRASLGIARADLFPTVNGNTSYTREKQSKNGVISLLSGGNPGTASNGLGGTTAGIPPTSSSSSSSTSALYTPFNLYQYGFDATWEIDFWGRVRRNVESSKAQAAQSEEQRRNTLLTSLAELARDYIQLRGTQRQLQITQENLETDRQSLTLTQQRAAGGLTTDLDVANAAAQVATTAAQLPTYEEQQSQLINAISLLLGEAPNAMLVELATPKPIPPVPPRVPIGVPSEIARRRPDVRQAEAQLHSATADVGVAVADFFPQVTLSGSLALQTISASSLADWESRTYSLGPQITLPIFQGGKLRRTLELRQTQQQEAALNYQRTVLQALHDVDNALTSYENEQRRNAQLAEAVTQNQKAVALSRDRYTQGISDFLSVLDAERSLLAAQTQLTTSTTTISTNLVQLYKALGGGWEQDYPEAAPDAGGAEQSAGL